MEQYQDMWQQGRCVGKGVRECESRYEALRPLLSQYTRPFTVLDLGASFGYFSFRIAEEFPHATVVAIDDNSYLWPQCLINNNRRVIHLRKRMTEHQVWQLADCEHFDVTLALNVIHHFDPWVGVSTALLAMGDHLVIETPAEGEPTALNYHNAIDIYKELESWPNKELLTETPSHVGPVKRPMWYFPTPGNALERPYMTAPEGLAMGSVTIDSNFYQKTVTLHRKNETRPWIPGINLQTFLSMHGMWPLPATLVNEIEAYPRPAERHGDVTPWNFVLSGDGLHLIDGRDDRAVQPTDDFHKVAEIVRRHC